MVGKGPVRRCTSTPTLIGLATRAAASQSRAARFTWEGTSSRCGANSRALLRSAEAELYTSTRGASEGLGAQSFLEGPG